MPRLIPKVFFHLARLILLFLFFMVTVLQLFSFPGQFRYEAMDTQSSQLARWALTLLIGLWLLMAQLAILALWKVLTMIYKDRLYSQKGSYWFNALVRILACSAGFGIAITLGAAFAAEDPGPVVILSSFTAFLTAIYITGFFIRYEIFKSFRRESAM